MGAEEALQLGLVARTAECAVTSALQMADQVRVSILHARIPNPKKLLTTRMSSANDNEQVGHD